MSVAQHYTLHKVFKSRYGNHVSVAMESFSDLDDVIADGIATWADEPNAILMYVVDSENRVHAIISWGELDTPTVLWTNLA